MTDIFSSNLLAPKKPYRQPKARHYHLRPIGKGFTAEDERGTYTTIRKALDACPDDWEVAPCPFDHAPNRPVTGENK